MRAALRCSASRCWRSPPARKSEDPGYQGWVEADLIFVSPDEAGRVETLSVREGEAVEKGAPLFGVDPELQQADVEMAKASVTNATQAYERAQTLFKTSAGTQKTVEDAEADAPHRAGAARLGADAAGAPQGVKPGDRLGAADLLSAGRDSCRPDGRWCRCCRRATSRSASSCRRRRCPRVALGEAVTIHCDGCKTDVTARVTFISRTSEFTPPVIYSLDERSKLVFLIEARTDTPGELRVGQPVDVRFAEPRK